MSHRRRAIRIKLLYGGFALLAAMVRAACGSSSRSAQPGNPTPVAPSTGGSAY